MNQNNVSPSQPINQRRLMDLLKLSPSVIRYLKDNNILRYKRVGTEDIFDEHSVNRFMESFKVDDYLTIGECRKVLVKREYYTIKWGWKKIYIHNLGFYITVKQLIRGGYGIPSQYRLTTKEFGKTQYISKESFKRTLDWLDEVNEQLHPKSDPNVVFQTKPKTPKKKGLGGLRKINTTKQQSPHPLIIPSMVCPLSPLTH